MGTVSSNTTSGVGPKRAASRKGLFIALAISVPFLVIEVVGSLLTNSLALLADAGHILTDVVAIVLALLAMWFAARPAPRENTYGYYRVEILAVLLNGLLLFGVVAYILYQAYQRLLSQPEVLSLPMLFVAVAGLLANIASGIVLKKASEESLNVRIVYVHVWTDALQSVGVIIAAFVMLFTGWFLADPIVSIVIALFIYWTGWRIARAAVKVLLESAPRHVDVESLRQRMLQVEGVANVHDIHAWSITTGYEVLSAHVVMTNPRHVDRNSLLNRLRDVARKEFKIDHITIQLEETAAKCQEAHAQ